MLALTYKDDKKILLMPLSKHLKGDLSLFIKYSIGEDALLQFIKLIQLISSKDESRNSAILIKGYVNFHEMTCTDELCPLK